ncbi:hypothetical protein BC567DRAFT_98447 [Phyllosticta citribraziliensis]
MALSWLASPTCTGLLYIVPYIHQLVVSGYVTPGKGGLGRVRARRYGRRTLDVITIRSAEKGARNGLYKIKDRSFGITLSNEIEGKLANPVIG